MSADGPALSSVVSGNDAVRYSAIDDNSGVVSMTTSKSPQQPSQPPIIHQDASYTDKTHLLTSEISESSSSYSSSSSRSQQEKLSTNATLVHVIKGFVGTGNLALPYAVANVGLLVAAVGIPACGAVFVYGMHILVSSSRLFCKFTGRNRMDYGYTLQFAFEYGPKKCQWFSKYAKKFMNSILCVQQMGFLIIYFVFIGENIREVINYSFEIDWPVQAYIALVLPVIILINLIRNVEVLALVSIVGIAVQIVGTIIIFGFLLEEFLPLDEVKLVEINPFKYPIFISTVAFSFEGICVVLPLENKMAEPEEMTSSFGVINIGLSLVTIFYFAIAFFGYMRVGDKAMGVITLNLPNEPLYDSLKMVFSVVVISSYAIQFLVAHEILFGRIKKWIVNERRVDVWDYVVRVAVVVFTAAFAASFPHIGPFISLVGAIFGIPVSISIPVAIDLLRRTTTRPENDDRLMWRILLDSFLLVFSVLAIFSGAIASVNEIIAEFQT